MSWDATLQVLKQSTVMMVHIIGDSHASAKSGIISLCFRDVRTLLDRPWYK